MATNKVTVRRLLQELKIGPRMVLAACERGEKVEVPLPEGNFWKKLDLSGNGKINLCAFPWKGIIKQLAKEAPAPEDPYDGKDPSKASDGPAPELTGPNVMRRDDPRTTPRQQAVSTFARTLGTLALIGVGGYLASRVGLL